MSKSTFIMSFVIALSAFSSTASFANICEDAANSDKTPALNPPSPPKKKPGFFETVFLGKSDLSVLEENVEKATNHRASSQVRELALKQILALYGKGTLHKSDIESALIKVIPNLLKTETQRLAINWLLENGDLATANRFVIQALSLPDDDREKASKLALIADILFELSVLNGFTPTTANFFDTLDIKPRFALALGPSDDGKSKNFKLSSKSIALRHQIYEPFRFWINITKTEPMVLALETQGNASLIDGYIDGELRLDGQLGYFDPSVRTRVLRDERQDEAPVRSPFITQLYGLAHHRLTNALKVPDQRQPDGVSRLKYPSADAMIHLIYAIKMAPQLWTDTFTTEFLYLVQTLDPVITEFFQEYFPQILPFLTAKSFEDITQARAAPFDVSSKLFWFSTIVTKPDP